MKDGSVPVARAYDDAGAIGLGDSGILIAILISASHHLSLHSHAHTCPLWGDKHIFVHLWA